MSILALTVMIILQLIMMIIFFQVKNSTTSSNDGCNDNDTNPLKDSAH